ncbi:hypothetical protein B296_00010328 [Ensete ventricosum]|uniref:Uncharacterized protein n=1 Tax=Ensete ventricosum TaxID=4639 RepID=A0A427A7H6_ENSVE|nr:hypothetical protein B296_00010328 [Ensete ventricosum]
MVGYNGAYGKLCHIGASKMLLDVSTIILSSSGGAALVNSGAAEALTVMQSGGEGHERGLASQGRPQPSPSRYVSLFHLVYQVFSDHTFRRVEMFNLGKMKSGSGVGSGSTAPSSVAMVVIVPTAGKLPGTDMGASLKKRSKRAAPEEPVDASESTTEVLVGGGREPVGRRLRKSPSGGSTRVWIEGLLVKEYLRGALHPTLAKKLYECSSEKLMNRAAKSAIWSLKSQRKDLEQEISILHSSLDGARDDRARLEGDVLSLTKAVALLEAELKAEGPKAVAIYNASEGSSRASRRWGQISYEFRYRVALEWLGERHTEVEVENDPFAKCLEDGNVKIDLCQPFNDNAPS